MAAGRFFDQEYSEEHEEEEVEEDHGPADRLKIPGLKTVAVLADHELPGPQGMQLAQYAARGEAAGVAALLRAGAGPDGPHGAAPLLAAAAGGSAASACH